MCSKKPTAPPQRIPRKDEPKEEEQKQQQKGEDSATVASEKDAQARPQGLCGSGNLDTYIVLLIWLTPF